MRDVARLECDIDRCSLKVKQTKIVPRCFGKLISVASVIN